MRETLRGDLHAKLAFVGSDKVATPEYLGEGPPVRVEVIVKRDCHLCEDALAAVAQVCEPLGVGWCVANIEDNSSLAIEYAEFVPVVLVDGQRHDFWRVDAARLRAALTS